MADDDRRDERRLELPSLRPSFRRRRGTQTPAPEPAEVAESSPDDSATLPPASVDGPDLSPGPTGLPETQPDVRGPVLTAPEQPAPRQRARIQRIQVPAPVAAAVTGAVVGLLLVGLTAGSLGVCSSIRGTPSCGKPGILLLLAITAVAVLVGALLLRVARVASPGSTSFLGVGLLVVLVLLALLGALDQWWVVIVVPALAAVTHLAAWWLTTLAGTGERARSVAE